MFCVKDANRIGLRKHTQATKINRYAKNAEASNERRNNLKGKAEQGDNMKVEEYYRISTDEVGGYVEFTQQNNVNSLSLTGLGILCASEIVKLKEFLDILEVKGLL